MQKTYSVVVNQRIDFYELWQQHKQLNIMEMKETWPCSKPLGSSMVDSAFHSSEVDKTSTGNFWELGGKN